MGDRSRPTPQQLLSANVARLLLERGWTEADLVDRIDALEGDAVQTERSRAGRASNLRRYLDGTRWPGRPETLDLLARALDVELEALFRRRGS